MKWKIVVVVLIVAVLGITMFALLGDISKLVERIRQGGSEVEVIEEKVEKIGGKYNAEIRYSRERYGGQEYETATIFYYVEGREETGRFCPKARPALDWIKNNTSENSLFLSFFWGGMIKGYAEREAVMIREQPLSAEANETARDICLAFVTTDINETIAIMKKYGASHIFVYHDPKGPYYMGTLREIFWTASDYGVFEGPAPLYGEVEKGEEIFEESGNKTVIARLIQNRETNGLVLLYSDEYVKIYQLKQ